MSKVHLRAQTIRSLIILQLEPFQAFPKLEHFDARPLQLWR